MKTYFRLLSFAKPIEKFAIPYILFTLLAIIFNTLNLALLAPLLDTLFSSTKVLKTPTEVPAAWDIMGNFNYYVNYYLKVYGAWTTLKIVCSVIVVSVFLANIFAYLSQRIMENLRAHTLLNLRKSVFNNMIDLHLGYFSNERKGDIMSKITNDVQVVQYSVTGTLQVIFKEPLQIIAYLVILLNISVKLTLISLLVVPIAGFVVARIVKNLKQQAINLQQSFGLMISYLDEALTGIKIVKAFNASFRMKDRFNSENRTYTNIVKAMARRQQLASPTSQFLSVLMISGIVLYGGYLILNKQSELTSAQFIVYIGIFSQLTRPVKSISDSFSNIHQGIAAGERVLELIDTKPAITDQPDAKVVDGFNDKIEFRNVDFAYGDKIVLKDITAVIPKGKTIALVGPSGGGKSTLMDLLPRFTEPKSGSILFDGIDTKTIKAESLRAQMGFVNQESILFNDSIFNNIAFGKPDATLEEVEAAAKIANAHDFITQTENGYFTNIGDRGMKLSGGQKQRINIARAVLSNPSIMLLDEATSALDTESEKLVQDALNNLMQNRTTLVIAHRLSTIQNADEIMVLEGGRIVEHGTHTDLISKNGLYSKLVNMQTFE
ncbi:ATP-binding cassette domain-containing protein [Pedobacter sp. HMF7647]|uniref:ATP-binding cassette domain-containing protein n=1 Tax=Hufsiella arboris TaxID=2695275 RepID=A0A7K1Y613_9SPHI|nr:ABC transporter ATP-binding protein [Hufsiella arboris]MXV50013.1 ATP-binding cassette domain-containing protein [Hufsiella arboris]